jgi:hypothetical protein
MDHFKEDAFWLSLSQTAPPSTDSIAHLLSSAMCGFATTELCLIPACGCCDAD